MRQRHDPARVDREVRVEMVRELDAGRLRDETQELPVRLEGPGPACLRQGQPGLVVPDPTQVAATISTVSCGVRPVTRAPGLRSSRRMFTFALSQHVFLLDVYDFADAT